MSERSEELMPHWRKNHDSNVNHLKHYDLLDEASTTPERDEYHSPVVLIEKMSVERMVSREKPKGERRNFAHFKGKSKPLGLNVTNCEVLEAMSGGSDPARWVGLQVQLYVDRQARYPSGKKGPAIRIKPMRASGPADTGPLPGVSDAARERLEGEHAERIEEREPGVD